MKSPRYIHFILIVFLVFSCYSFIGKEFEEPGNNQTSLISPKPNSINVILMIGDGMGLSQVSAGLYYQKETSNFERFPYIGLSKTSSSSDKITDSAAGATAFACGEKTYNGAIGVSPAGESIENIVEDLSKLNYNTGVIATSAITHATPACFYAHVASRNDEDDIAAQLVSSDIDFFSGGGLKFFNMRNDGQDLLVQLKNNGFLVSTSGYFTKKEIKNAPKVGMLLSTNGMPTMQEGRGDFLIESTKLAFDYFNNSNQPFFMMIEGSQIDWGGHGNNATYLINEQLDFDRTIGFVLDYAERNKNTLVIVTADHETGGFTLSSKNMPTENGEMESDYNMIEPSFATNGHSGTMVPVFAYGPGSEKFAGVYENTEIYHKILSIINK